MITVNFGHCGVGYGIHHFGAVFRDTAVLEFLSDDKSGDVLKKHQRDVTLGAQFDEMSCLQGALGKENAVVADDADRDIPKSARSRTPQSGHIAL